MNLILLEEQDLDAQRQSALVRGRRFEHMVGIQGASAGDEVAVGIVGGNLGTGRIAKLERDHLVLEVSIDHPPPSPRKLEVIAALPRPLILKRLLHGLTTLGVKRIHLIGARKVERSFWNSRALKPEAIREQLILGLEQARDTRLPEVHLHPYFRPFTEEVLGHEPEPQRRLLADPGALRPCPQSVDGATLLAIGPEGGFNEFEVEQFEKQGFERVGLGERILRVDVAATYAVARLCP